ncbi:unnamed protein product [Euphydryas editha]|uniref:Peptidase S1 domain-containing protein n=1 Tax=Euphydryas editha TaxID=104508 RepID=A0AAU9TNZ3_EUPED|nr:unnamed protein product [Euphydryas editha]
MVDEELYILFLTPPKEDKVLELNLATRQMFDGANVEDIINYTISYEELCELKELYFKKDFSSPGRRISEVKCLEYIWDSMFMELKVSQKEYCYEPVIIGGRAALYGEFPHMGALGWRSAQNNSDWLFKCGASLISEKFMLTAAHCSYIPRGDVTISSPNPEIVKLGDKFIINNREKESKSIYVPIKRIIKHEQYKAPIRYYDIAIIELAEAVNIGPIIRPACLWSSSDTSPIDKLSITGWGVVDPGKVN